MPEISIVKIAKKETEMANEKPILSIEEGQLKRPPNGGVIAWVQCASSFCLFLISWGVVNSFGQYQSYYKIAFPSHSASQISWIGSLQASLLIGLGVVVGPIYDLGYLRSLVWTGCFLNVLAMMLVSISTAYWHLVLAQGVVFGIGSGCLFVPCIAVLPEYFKKRQSLALGVGASGGALGGIVFPILFQQLQPRIGFAWTTRIIAFIMILFSVVPLFGMRMLRRPTEVRKMFDTSAWREVPFNVSSIFLFLVFMSVYIPLFYIQSYGLETKTITGGMGNYLLPLMNTGSLLGRILPPHLADKYGPFNIEVICVFICSILAFTWITLRSTASVMLFSIFYGFFAGAITSISPNIAVALSPNMDVLGVRLGMLLLPISAGLLIGNPLAGLVGATGWISLQIFTGALLVASFMVVVNARVLMYGSRLRVRC